MTRCVGVGPSALAFFNIRFSSSKRAELPAFKAIFHRLSVTTAKKDRILEDPEMVVQLAPLFAPQVVLRCRPIVPPCRAP